MPFLTSSEDVNKPNGQKLIPQEREAIISYMSTLPIRKVPGIGRVTERILKALGVDVCGDLVSLHCAARVIGFATYTPGGSQNIWLSSTNCSVP